MSDNDNDDPPGLTFDDRGDEDGLTFDPRLVAAARAVREEFARARGRAPAENDPIELARQERDLFIAEGNDDDDV